MTGRLIVLMAVLALLPQSAIADCRDTSKPGVDWSNCSKKIADATRP